jgi:hypothetical protein
MCADSTRDQPDLFGATLLDGRSLKGISANEPRREHTARLATSRIPAAPSFACDSGAGRAASIRAKVWLRSRELVRSYGTLIPRGGARCHAYFPAASPPPPVTATSRQRGSRPSRRRAPPLAPARRPRPAPRPRRSPANRTSPAGSPPPAADRATRGGSTGASRS